MASKRSVSVVFTALLLLSCSILARSAGYSVTASRDANCLYIGECQTADDCLLPCDHAGFGGPRSCVSDPEGSGGLVCCCTG